MKKSEIIFESKQGQCVTGSKHFLKIDDKYILIDYGAWQGGQDEEKQNQEFTCPVPVDKIETVLITHSHNDHIGLLPKLIKEGYKGKIRSTPATRDLASIILLDSAKIQQSERKVFYTEADVVKTMNQFRCHFYHKEKHINDNVKVTFYDAGHILGSSLIDINVTKKRLFGLLKSQTHILFTGDLGRESSPITNAPETDIPCPDYIVLESTYGNRTHQSSGVALKEFANVINRTVERGGKVIIPSFAIERAQEIIYHLKTLMAEEKIPRIPVYVDSPMAINATGVFNIHPECFNKKIQDDFISKGKNPFSVASLHCVNDYKESLEVAKKRTPCIIIAASGMMEAGRILTHLRYNISNPKNTILIVGYQGEHTLGREIQEKNPYVNIQGEEYKLNAEVQSLSAFSSHADYTEMYKWLSKMNTSKLKKIFLVHGNTDSQEFLKDYLTTKGFKVEIVQKDVKYKLV